ncbi:hypothetical protein ACWGR4_03295 [Embleya sp. NPDC055664]
MSRDPMATRRGDHTDLVTLVASQLDTSDRELAAAARPAGRAGRAGRAARANRAGALVTANLGGSERPSPASRAAEDSAWLSGLPDYAIGKSK